MEHKWSIRCYKNGDEKKIVDLMNIVYGKWHSLEYWDWKYKVNPKGFFNELIWIAEDGGKFVGYYAVIPIEMKIQDDEVLALQSVDTATHPDYRRQGIFRALANKTYMHAAKLGMPILYGFTAAGPSHEVLIKKLNWCHICFLMEAVKLLDHKTALNRYFKDKYPKFVISLAISFLKLRDLILRFRNKLGFPSLPTNLTIRKAHSFDERIDDFWRKVSQEYRIIVKRNLDYFKWRLSDPESEYAIYLAEKKDVVLGYVILKRIENSALVVDILALPGEDLVAKYLLSMIIKFLKREKIDSLRCRIPKTHKYYQILKQLGFITIKTKMGFIARSTTRNSSTEQLLKNISSWFVTYLDSDHV